MCVYACVSGWIWIFIQIGLNVTNQNTKAVKVERHTQKQLTSRLASVIIFCKIVWCWSSFVCVCVCFSLSIHLFRPTHCILFSSQSQMRCGLWCDCNYGFMIKKMNARILHSAAFHWTNNNFIYVLIIRLFLWKDRPRVR